MKKDLLNRTIQQPRRESKLIKNRVRKMERNKLKKNKLNNNQDLKNKKTNQPKMEEKLNVYLLRNILSHL